MEYQIGERVIYGTAGVCEYAGVETRTFEGIGSNEYCKLIPMQASHTSFYVPVSAMEQKIRPLLSRDEIYGLIDGMPEVEADPVDGRLAPIVGVPGSEDYRRLIARMKSVYAQKHQHASRRVSAADERTVRNAEQLMYHEFAAVLEIEPTAVSDFIQERLRSQMTAASE